VRKRTGVGREVGEGCACPEKKENEQWKRPPSGGESVRQWEQVCFGMCLCVPDGGHYERAGVTRAFLLCDSGMSHLPSSFPQGAPSFETLIMKTLRWV
jgi:hypothetical protein